MFSIKEKEKNCRVCDKKFKTISPFILICSDQCRKKKKNFKSKQRYEKLKKCPSAYAKFLKKSRDRLRKYPVGSSKYCKC